MTSQPNPCTEASPIGCFAKGTLVRTPNGMFPIERLEVGDLVVTGDGRAALIAKTHQTTATELLRIQFSDGSTLHSTPWHRFFDLRHNLVKAADLEPGTIARTHDGSIVTVTRVAKVVSGTAHEVFNLSLERDISFFANGKLVEAPRASRILNGHSLLAAGSL
jgi:hypothetical protein